jgi:hypothetical protein
MQFGVFACDLEQAGAKTLFFAGATLEVGV